MLSSLLQWFHKVWLHLCGTALPLAFMGTPTSAPRPSLKAYLQNKVKTVPLLSHIAAGLRITPCSSSPFHDLPHPVAMHLWLLVSFSSSCLPLCISTKQRAFTFPASSLSLFCGYCRLMYFPITSRGTLFTWTARWDLLMQSANSCLFPVSVSWYFSLSVYYQNTCKIWCTVYLDCYSHSYYIISSLAESPHTAFIFSHQNS